MRAKSGDVVFCNSYTRLLAFPTPLPGKYAQLEMAPAYRVDGLMREEPQLAACMGYDLRSLKSRAIMASAALTALAGSLYAHYMSFVGPDYMLAAETFWLWTMLMIGGLGNTGGVLVGVIVVQAAYAMVPFAKDAFGFSSDISGALRLGLIGFILLASLLWRSEGLVPEKVRKIA